MSRFESWRLKVQAQKKNEECPTCGESSTVRPMLVLIDSLWEPVSVCGRSKRYVTDLSGEEVKPEAVQERQVARGYFCEHCGKAFVAEYALESAKTARLLHTKQGSWVWLTGWVEDMPSHNESWAPFAAFVLPLLKECVDAGLDDYFRVGQSMSHIIFSTSEKHGLEKYGSEKYDPTPLRITLKFDHSHKRWYVARSYKNLWFAVPDMETSVDSETAFPVLKQYLTELWTETRPGEPVPQPLLSR